jgi:hypothetical protein
MKKKECFAVLLMLVVLAGCKKDKDSQPAPEVTVVSASGDVQVKIDQFRTLLGPLNNGGATTAGRREINWDAVPEDQLGKPLPDNFFNATGPNAVPGRQRGLTYTPKGGSFAVSKLGFTEINPGLKQGFKPFSGTNTFANTTAVFWEVGFEVPGEAVPAFIQGFGAVFSGVDKPNTAFLEFFDGTRSLGKHFIPVRGPNSPFSFLGVYFPKGQRVTKIAVSHTGAVASGQPDIADGGPEDLFVMDDFFYTEPQRI